MEESARIKSLSPRISLLSISTAAIFLKLYQHRSYVIALENAQNVDGMYVDECKTGFSFRNYGNLLLLGGGGHRTGKDGGNWNKLRRFADENYPDAMERYYWAAQDCMSLDDIPYIGAIPQTHRICILRAALTNGG